MVHYGKNKNMLDECPSCKGHKLSFERQPVGSGTLVWMKVYKCEDCLIRMFTKVYPAAEGKEISISHDEYEGRLQCDKCELLVSKLWFAKDGSSICDYCKKEFKG
jgi:hypothetical protein